MTVAKTELRNAWGSHFTLRPGQENRFLNRDKVTDSWHKDLLSVLVSGIMVCKYERDFIGIEWSIFPSVFLAEICRAAGTLTVQS